MRPIILVCIVVIAVASLLSLIEAIDPQVDRQDSTRRLGFLAAGFGLAIVAVSVALAEKLAHRLSQFLLVGFLLLYGALFMVNLIVISQDSNFDYEQEQISLRKSTADALGIPFDDRKFAEAILSARQEDPSTYPVTSATYFLKDSNWPSALMVANEEVLPIGGLVDTPVMICNDLGHFPIWNTDRYGFNNPDFVWDELTELNSIVIGDSFVAGECLDQGNDIASQFRGQNHKSLSLGVGGAGPLTALAALREYGMSARPDFVFWVFYSGNDFADLESELAHPILSRYLDPDYSQSLKANAADSDVAYRELVEKRLEAWTDFSFEAPESARSLRSYATDVATYISLKQIGRRIAERSGLATPYTGAQIVNIEKFEMVAELMNAESEKLGAQLVFVYLPTFGELESGTANRFVSNQTLFEILQNDGVPVIDLTSGFFEPSDPSIPFVMGLGNINHFSPAGYARLANELLEFAAD